MALEGITGRSGNMGIITSDTDKTSPLSIQEMLSNIFVIRTGIFVVLTLLCAWLSCKVSIRG